MILKGKEGERGRLGPKEFYFQVPDVGALGTMNGVVLVYILGKGRYSGTVYGARVEGVSEGDEVFGVPPVRGSSAHLEVGGIWVDKELPDPKELKPANFDLPYRVLEAGRKLKVALEDEFDVIEKKHYKAKGVLELPYGSVLVYKGIPERPSRVETEKAFEAWTGEVERAFKVPKGLVVHASRTTFLVTDGKIKDLGFRSSCYFNDELYAIGNKAFVKGKSLELPSESFSCARVGKYAVFSLPSRPVRMQLKLFSPLVTVDLPTEVPWKVPWSDLPNAHLVVYDIEKGKLYKLELSPGAYGLYLGKRLYAYNLFGELRAYDRGLKLLWVRESNGVRDVEERDYLAIWTYRPPRIRVYKAPFQQVFKAPTGLDSVALCSDDFALYAVDGERIRAFLPWANFYELFGKAEGGLACKAFDRTVVIVGKNGVSAWRLKVRGPPG